MNEKGYVSIVQYQPDAARQEAANVGLVLFCPEPRRLDVRMAVGMGHVARFFGKRVDGEFLSDMKRALEGRLRAEAKAFHSEADLMAFAHRLGNELRLTEPRGVALTMNYEALLDDLFTRLVAEPKPERSPRSGLGRKLRNFFDRLPEQNAISRNRRVELPDIDEVEAPYAYDNRTLHLVKPIRLDDRARDEARSWLFVDEVLQDNAASFTRLPKVEIVLARADTPEETERRDYCARILSRGRVNVFSEERFGEFERHVSRELSHPLPGPRN